MKSKSPRPTDGELQILTILWELGPSSVRQVLDAMPSKPAPGYTTVLKLLQIMTEKGLVVRDESERTHIYRAKRAKQQTQKQMLGEVLARVFGGSTNQLVMQALAIGRLTPDELVEIRQLLDGMEEGE